MLSAMTDAKTYGGSCQCGKVRFETTTDLSRVISCNCSICGKHGLLLNFVSEDKFKLLSGDAALTKHLFNKMKIEHHFCATCGVETFGTGNGKEGKRMYAVNVRCLDDLDLSTLTLTPFDGKSL